MFIEKNLENTEKYREDKIISTQSNMNMQFDVFLSSLFMRIINFSEMIKQIL